MPPLSAGRSLGQRLRALRKRKGLSQLELLAEFFGVTVMYFLQDDRMVDWERRKAQIEAWLASLAERDFTTGKLLYDKPIPDQILQQILRWQERSAMLED